MKNTNDELRAPLTIHIEGPATADHRLPLADIVLFAQQLQTAIDRVARLLTGRLTSAQRGRLPSSISRWCALDLIEIGPGSVTLVCDLPKHHQPQLIDDLGIETVRTLVTGIAELGLPESALPASFDKGVLLALREVGKLFDHGVYQIGLDFTVGDRTWSSQYTPQVHERLVAQIQGPVETRRVVEGRLLRADFKETGRQCRVHRPQGRPVDCTFDEDQQQAVLAALTRRVRIVGEAQESDGEILRLTLSDIEILDDDELGEVTPVRSSFFEPKLSLAALAVEQGVSRVVDFDQLLGDFWPDDESADDIITAVREWRHEGE